MKKIITLFGLSIAIFLLSCTRSSNDLANSNNQSSSSGSQTVTSGTWKVTLFTDSGNDETSDFNGYSFAFNSGGMLVATRNGISQNGSWSLNTSSNKFNIDLGLKSATNRLGELTDDWKILSRTDTEIRLTDDNPASNEFLTFVKN